MRERSRIEKKVHFLETINTFGSLLMRTSTTQESAWCVAKHAVGELEYIDCIIYLINADRELYQCAAHGNKNPSAQDILDPIKLKMGEGICGHVALTGIGEIIADTSKDPRYVLDDEDRYSEITVPILSDGIVIGIIDSEHPEKDYFSDHDLHILNTIASMLSFKISQAKAIEELARTNKQLAFQNEEKQKRADELAIANKAYAFQNEEKERRANELALANAELAFQNEEKQKQANALTLAIKKLAFQNDEKEKRADELVIANKELALQNDEKQKRANELAIANKELEFQVLLTKNRIETESIAKELRQFIETANAPIFGIDNKGRVNEWNQTSEKITGFKKDDVLGKDLVQTYITQDYQNQVKEVLDNALKGQETANYEFPLFTKDGQRVMVLLNSSTRRNAEDEIVGVIGVGQDITILNEHKENLESKVESRTQELQESLEREKELGQLKTSFVSMASHEFRTPLTSINAIADIILRYYEKLSRDDINKRLEKIKEEVEYMVIMLEDILIIGKSDAQKLDYNPELLDIVSLIKDIITEYQFGESEKRFIVYEISFPVIMAQVDKKWIKHIIVNLFSNALKYSNKDKQIEISIKKDQSGISFSFEDYGIGISKQDIKLLFKPFHRGENVQNISGTGLGLAILQKAVELHKGRIVVKSKIGKGSYFRIILPTHK
jgi:PAS domain S-box-containing protein